MKTLKILALLVLAASLGFGQTNVDKLVERLEFLGKGSIDNWKYAVNPPGDPSRPDYDDSQWQTLKLNESVYPDSCWIRRVVVLPDRLLGEPVSGIVRFLVSVDDYGYFWVDGESKGRFPWDGEFEITKDAKAGQRIVLAIKAINTGGPLRLIRALIQAEVSKKHAATIDDLSLSFRVGQKLLSFDTYQTNSRRRVDPKTDKSTISREEREQLGRLLQEAATKVDLQALESGDMVRFIASVDQVKSELKSVSEFAKRFTLFFDSNAHIDAAWLWREGETVEVAKNTFTSVLNMMDSRPDFTYTQSAAAYYYWMQTMYPDIYKRIQQRVKDGRWEVIGGMWVEPDCNLPGGESWMRHLLYAKRYFRKELGVDVKIGWNPDSFGYNWNMPLFYQMAGIDAFITQKIGWNDTNVFPHRVFWWNSPDGSRILSYFPFDYVNEISNPYTLVDWLRQFEANTGYRNMLMLFGVGDHGGGPSNEMLDRIDRLKQATIYPTVQYGTTTSYLNWLKKQDLSTLPVWNDELYLEYHRGTYTTQAKMKKFNRTSEVLLTNTEKFSALSTLAGGMYNQPAIEDAWRLTLFNQFHDILPGSSIREVYIDATETHTEAQKIAGMELDKSLDQIAKSVNTSSVKNGTPLVVFNPLSWARTEVVHYTLPTGDEKEYAVFEQGGKEITSQIVRIDRFTREILFPASNVPSMGYKTYVLRAQKPKPTPSVLKWSIGVVENENFKVVIDTASGWITSIIDKRSSRELLSGPANRLQLLEDKPSAWDAWNIGLTGVEFPSRLVGVKVVENGPVRTILRLKREYRRPGTSAGFPTENYPTSFFTQDIILISGSDRIDFKTDVDWWEEKTMLKVAFPVSVSAATASYEIPYGSIQRPAESKNSVDSAKWEVAGIRWADLSQKDYGVSLLNRAKYGYDIKGSTMRLSLLRSPKWPDPTADRGKHSIEYSLYPHAGQWKLAKTVQRGYEFNNPMIVVAAGVHRGSLPASQSFVKLEPSNLVLTTLKKAEDSNAWVVQWYDAVGVETEALLTLPRPVKRAVTTNALEEDGYSLKPERNTLRIITKKSGVTTLKIEF